MHEFQLQDSALPGPKVLIEGDAGSGKTYSLHSLVDHGQQFGLEVFYLAIESGLEALLGYWVDQGLPIPENLHWHKITAPKTDFATLAERAWKVNTMTYKTLAEESDPKRHLYNLFIRVNEAFVDFPDDRTGQKFGAVDKWSPNRVVVIDGLTGLNGAVMSLVVGGKAMRNIADYGMAQGQLEGFLRLICDHCRCWFVLLAHVEKEVDQVKGGQNITISAPGKALAPTIPAMFSDVIYSLREGTTWTWNTSTTGVVTKARNLPWAEKLPPNFGPLFDTWYRRALAASQGVDKST